MGDVRPLLREVTNAPDPDIVRMVEDILAMAKTGEITMVAFAFVCRDRSTSHGFACVDNSNLVQLSGVLEYLKMRVLKKHDER